MNLDEAIEILQDYKRRHEDTRFMYVEIETAIDTLIAAVTITDEVVERAMRGANLVEGNGYNFAKTKAMLTAAFHGGRND